MKSEPAVTVATLASVITALIALLAAFGLNVSDDQQKAIIAFVGVVAHVVAGFITRSKVTPVSGKHVVK